MKVFILIVVAACLVAGCGKNSSTGSSVERSDSNTYWIPVADAADVCSLVDVKPAGNGMIETTYYAVYSLSPQGEWGTIDTSTHWIRDLPHFDGVIDSKGLVNLNNTAAELYGKVYDFSKSYWQMTKIKPDLISYEIQEYPVDGRPVGHWKSELTRFKGSGGTFGRQFISV